MAVVQMALMKALELKRGELITLFLKLPAISTERINMGKLYSLVTNELFRSNRTLKKRLRICAADNSNNGGASFLKQYDMYCRAISPVFRDLHPILNSVLEANDRTRPHDIFLWMVSSGDEDLARIVWPFCHLPIHVALLGALLSKSLSERVQGLQARWLHRLCPLSARSPSSVAGAHRDGRVPFNLSPHLPYAPQTAGTLQVHGALVASRGVGVRRPRGRC